MTNSVRLCDSSVMMSSAIPSAIASPMSIPMRKRMPRSAAGSHHAAVPAAARRRHSALRPRCCRTRSTANCRRSALPCRHASRSPGSITSRRSAAQAIDRPDVIEPDEAAVADHVGIEHGDQLSRAFRSSDRLRYIDPGQVGPLHHRSALPSCLAQTIEHVFMVLRTEPRRAGAHVTLRMIATTASIDARNASEASLVLPSWPSAAASHRYGQGMFRMMRYGVSCRGNCGDIVALEIVGDSRSGFADARREDHAD